MVGGKLAKINTRWHPLYKLVLPAQFTLGSKYTQPEAKSFLPPNTGVWKSPVMGSWGYTMPPYKRHTEPFIKYGGDLDKALLVLLQHAWALFFRSKGGYPLSDCPIKGIFDN